MRILGRIAVVGSAAATIALAVAALLAVRRQPSESLLGSEPAELALLATAGLALFAAGAGVVLVRAAWVAGLLLAAAGPALFLGSLPLPDAGGAVLFSAALAGGSAAAALVGAGALFYLRSSRRLLDGAVTLAALAVTGIWLGVLPAATFDPAEAGCFACTRNLLLVHGAPGVRDALVRTGLYAAAAACAVLALATFGRWLQTTAPARWVVAPVLLGGTAAAVLAAVTFAHDARVQIRIVDSTTHVLWLAQCGALTVVAAGVASELARARFLSHRLAAMVVDAFPSHHELGAALGASIGDSHLSVVFPQGDGSVVDEVGQRVDHDQTAVSVTNVMRAGQTVAQLRHSDAFAHAPERLAEAVRAAGLALEYASSRARLRAQLAELTASRARIVEVGDNERRRLERNLHDGAQQRLIALSVALQRPDANGSRRTRARSEILMALEELRALAHGIHPAALTDAGLEAALRELADGSAVPLRFEGTMPPRLSASIETAAYRFVLDGILVAERAGDGGTVSVELQQTSDEVRVRLTLPGVDAASAKLGLQHAFDRVAALDGERTIEATTDGTRVEATLPCGS
jgi:signal transduction histidine kinase